MKIGMIGTGSFARRGVLPAITLAPDARLVAVYDQNPEAAAHAAQAYGGRVYPTIDAFLNAPDMDLVCIVTPPETHLGLVNTVIAAGKPFLCEKPVTVSAAQADQLAATAEAAGVIHAVDHEYRYDPPYRKMHDLVQSGYLGALRNSALYVISGSFADPNYEATKYWGFHNVIAQGGGLLPQQLSHYIDLHRYILGDIEPAGGYVSAMIAEKPTRPAVPGGADGPMHTCEAEDSVALAGRLPNGAPATISATYVAPAVAEVRWVIHGDEGVIVYERRETWPRYRLSAARKGDSQRIEIPLPPPRRAESKAGHMACLQENIADLLVDLYAVIKGGKAKGDFATLRDEARVWRNIEKWRAAAKP